MAEAIMKNLLKEYHLELQYEIESRATSNEEVNNPIYPNAQQKLREKGILDFTHYAQTFEKEDYDKFDLIIGMEDTNIYKLLDIVKSDPQKKIRKLIPNHNIADPWYTRDFEISFQEIKKGCEALIIELEKKRRGV